MEKSKNFTQKISLSICQIWHTSETDVISCGTLYSTLSDNIQQKNFVLPALL